MSELSEKRNAGPKELVEIRMKFHNLAKQSFPDVGEPGTVWVLSEVLGWDYSRITRVAVDGFNKKSYRMFIMDDDGKPVFTTDKYGERHTKMVTRQWTTEERKLLKDWWWLLGF